MLNNDGCEKKQPETNLLNFTFKQKHEIDE